MAKAKTVTSTRVRAKQNQPAGKKAVAKKPAVKKPASISFEKAIPELEREVKRIAGLESDPMLRAILTGRIILTTDEIADSIKDGFLEGKVIYDSNGAPDPKRSTIAANELPRFLDFIRRSLEETKTLYLEQENIENQYDPAHIILSYYFIPDEWKYWAGKPTLVADEAVPLMNGLDPGSWRNRDKRIPPPLPDEMVSAITRGLQIAEADGSKAKNPTGWLEWGRSHGLDKPIFKSDFNLREPDVSMWPLFADAVAEVERKAEKQNPKTGTVEQSQNTAPVVSAKHNTIKDESPKMKKAALIATLEAEGFENVADKFRHSHPGDGGLHDAAKHVTHGYWYVEKSRAWFVQEQGEPNNAKIADAPAKATAQKKNLGDYWPTK